MAHRRKKSLPSKRKAKKILEDEEIRGKPLTSAQKGLFGLIVGGGKPTRLKDKRHNPSPPFPNEAGEFTATGKVGVTERSSLE